MTGPLSKFPAYVPVKVEHKTKCGTFDRGDRICNLLCGGVLNCRSGEWISPEKSKEFRNMIVEGGDG